MVFGKIEYLNLLPFYIFMKRYAKSTRHHMSLQYKKGVPSKINRDFAARRVDAAFISSITARGCRAASLGIIARKEVLSVLLIPGDKAIEDTASATSNVLAKVLDMRGEVVIGDNALKLYLSGSEVEDLAKIWHERYRLPFVFALLCYHKHHQQMEGLSRTFLRQRHKIPQYLLKKASAQTGIAPKDILHYLDYISYEVDSKALQGLKKFWRLSDTL